jgi:hypothetical protein
MRTLFRENFLKGGQGSVIRPSSVLFLVCRRMRNRLQPNGKSFCCDCRSVFRRYRACLNIAPVSNLVQVRRDKSIKAYLFRWSRWYGAAVINFIFPISAAIPEYEEP